MAFFVFGKKESELAEHKVPKFPSSSRVSALSSQRD
jgi:hypothetical protein